MMHYFPPLCIDPAFSTGKLRLVFPHHITQRHLCAPFNRAPPYRNYPTLSFFFFLIFLRRYLYVHITHMYRDYYIHPLEAVSLFLFISILSSISYVCVCAPGAIRVEWNQTQKGSLYPNCVCAYKNDIFFYSCLVCVCVRGWKSRERTISQHNSISRTAASRRFSRFFK